MDCSEKPSRYFGLTDKIGKKEVACLLLFQMKCQQCLTGNNRLNTIGNELNREGGQQNAE